MILNISFRTDVVACYTDWLVDRLLNQKYIGSRNPYNPNEVYLFDTSSIEGIVFCSKDYSKILNYINDINNKYHCIYHYTITPYMEDIQPILHDLYQPIETLIELSNIVGKEKIVWRYDPIFINNEYTYKFIFDVFEFYCGKLTNYIDHATFNFLQLYKHVQDRMNILEIDKDYVVENLALLAKKYNISLQACGDKSWTQYGINIEGCITPKSLKLNIKPEKKPLLNNCMCSVHTYGIGSYDTCQLGCKYCYAIKDFSQAFKNYQLHDPKSELLIGHITEQDKIKIIDKKVLSNQLYLNL